jgi:hypothetical protein
MKSAIASANHFRLPGDVLATGLLPSFFDAAFGYLYVLDDVPKRQNRWLYD